jgi:hypothetical protein
MSFCDDTDSDLMLVSTYIPVLQECFKGLCLLSLNEVAMRFVHCQPAIFIMLVCVVYIDACYARTSKYATACGHLCAVAILLWQQCNNGSPEPSCVGMLTIAFWFVDLCWTLASSLYCTFIVFDYISHVQEVKMAFAVSVVYTVHTWTGCATHNIGDLMVRFVLYDSVCAILMFGGQVVLPYNDKYAQIRNVKWITSFVLFAAWAVLVPGLMVIVSVYVHAFYQKRGRLTESACEMNVSKLGDDGKGPVMSITSSYLLTHSLHPTSSQNQVHATAHPSATIHTVMPTATGYSYTSSNGHSHPPTHHTPTLQPTSNTHHFSGNNTKTTLGCDDTQQNILMRQLQAAKAAAESRKE